MNNKFPIDQRSKSESIDSNSINRLYKINTMQIRSNNREMTQKQICKDLKISDSTIKRYRKDINMDSPYNRNNYKKKKPKQPTDTKTEIISENENTKAVIDESSKIKIIEKRVKNRLKNEIKGGNISDSHILSSKEIIDYAFTNNQKDGYLEDKRLSGKELIEQVFKDTIND